MWTGEVAMKNWKLQNTMASAYLFRLVYRHQYTHTCSPCSPFLRDPTQYYRYCVYNQSLSQIHLLLENTEIEYLILKITIVRDRT